MIGAIVTGCSRGVGLALTRHLLARRCQVVGIARNAPDGLDTYRDTGALQFIAADLADSLASDRLLSDALAHLGQGHYQALYLINNAGVVFPMAPAGEYVATEVQQALAINLTTPILLTNAFVRMAPALCDEMRILNISSGAAVSTYPGWGVYGAGKAALDHFSRHVALEQAGATPAVRVAALYPGVVDTDMQAVIRQSDVRQFPNKPRFEALKRDGGLSGAEQTAERILQHLQSAAFGAEPVVDIRTLTFTQESP